MPPKRRYNPKWLSSRFKSMAIKYRKTKTSWPALAKAKAKLMRAGYKRRTRAEVMELKRIAALPPPLDIDAEFARLEARDRARKRRKIIY